MAKLRVNYCCSNCGNKVPKWLGKCAACNAFDTFIKEEEEPVLAQSGLKSSVKRAALSFDQTKVSATLQRVLTGSSEVDLVLGGGICTGSLILISGEPGIGKSTLMAQVAVNIAQKARVFYFSGEEAAGQISSRVRRLGLKMGLLEIFQTNSLEQVLATVQQALASGSLDLIIIDSVQTIFVENSSAMLGSLSQIKLLTETLLMLAKQTNIPIILIGHVTKDGNLAGPRSLEHLVDTVLFIEGDRNQSLRIIRGLKNRFGSTAEVGILEMTDRGLTPVTDLSFLTEGDAVGSVISAIIEGSRTLLVEIQSLCVKTNFGYPKRTASGIGLNRLNLLLAVASRHTGVRFDEYDVYLNLGSGMSSIDPALDLAILAALISARSNLMCRADILILAEVGLTGRVRAVRDLSRRVKAAEKMGFKCLIVADNDLKLKTKLQVYKLKRVEELSGIMKKLGGGGKK